MKKIIIVGLLCITAIIVACIATGNIELVKETMEVTAGILVLLILFYFMP